MLSVLREVFCRMCVNIRQKTLLQSLLLNHLTRGLRNDVGHYVKNPGNVFKKNTIMHFYNIT